MPVFDGRVLDWIMCLLVFWASAQDCPIPLRYSMGTPLATLLCDWLLILSPILWTNIRYLHHHLRLLTGVYDVVGHENSSFNVCGFR